ncbi:MAG: hypothetical protein ABH846_03920 [Patescibacteria group bacterium]
MAKTKKKHSFGKSIDIYGQIFLKSLGITWKHPELWLIGAIAGLASTGASFNHLFKTFLRVRPADQITFGTVRDILDGVPWLMEYGKNLLLLGPTRITMTIFFILILCVLVVIIMIGAQQIILWTVNKYGSSKKNISYKKIFSALNHWHFWRIFAVDALMYLTTIILLCLAALALTPLLSDSLGLNFLVYIAVYAILLPVAFIINIIGMLTLVTIVRKNDGILESFLHSYRIFKKHWLVAMETSLLLFLANGVGTILLILALLIYAIFISLLVLSSMSIGSVILMGVITFFGTLGGLFIIIGFGGFITSFNYSVWTQLTNRLERFGLLPAIESLFKK